MDANQRQERALSVLLAIAEASEDGVYVDSADRIKAAEALLHASRREVADERLKRVRS